MKLLVCGDRGWTDKLFIRDFILALNTYSSIDLIVEGGAVGADTLAGKIAQELDISLTVYPAEWTKYGRSAGYVRNTQMLEEVEPDLVVAFHDSIGDSKGTAHCLREAKKRSIRAVLVTHRDNIIEIVKMLRVET